MNINFEGDTRHNVSDRALRKLKETMYSQDDFGVNKYGKSLRSNMPYNWLEMAREEISDFVKYLECEEERKNLVIITLQMAEKSNNPKRWIREALELLETGGTGK
jgi:predicted nucleotidyltransferase component of viral defense system